MPKNVKIVYVFKEIASLEFIGFIFLLLRNPLMDYVFLYII